MVTTIRPGKICINIFSGLKVGMLVENLEILDFGDFGALAYSQDHFRLQNDVAFVLRTMF